MDKSEQKISKLAEARKNGKVHDEASGVDIEVRACRAGDVPALLDILKGLIGVAAPVIQTALDTLDENGERSITNEQMVSLATDLIGRLDGEQLQKLLDYLDSCIDVNAADLDLWLLPEVLTEWLRRSFGEGKSKGWAALGEFLATMLAGGEPDGKSASTPNDSSGN